MYVGYPNAFKARCNIIQNNQTRILAITASKQKQQNENSQPKSDVTAAKRRHQSKCPGWIITNTNCNSPRRRAVTMSRENNVYRQKCTPAYDQLVCSKMRKMQAESEDASLNRTSHSSAYPEKVTGSCPPKQLVFVADQQCD